MPYPITKETVSERSSDISVITGNAIYSSPSYKQLQRFRQGDNLITGRVTEEETREDVLIACTADAKVCPDGSYVSRQGPNCEFSPCPENLRFPDIRFPNIGCPEDARLCADGTTLSRIPPSCEFPPCPEDISHYCGNGICEAGEEDTCPQCVYDNPPCQTFAPCAGSCPEDCDRPDQPCPLSPVPLCKEGTELREKIDTRGCGYYYCEREEKGCPDNWDPICGQPQMPRCPEGLACPQVMPEKRTYGNMCELEAANAQFLYRGECGREECGQIAMPDCLPGYGFRKDVDSRGCPRYYCEQEHHDNYCDEDKFMRECMDRYSREDRKEQCYSDVGQISLT